MSEYMKMNDVNILLEKSKELDEQARQLRVQAGELIYKAGGHITIKELKDYGIKSSEYAHMLIEMYLTERGRQVRGEV